MAMKVTSKVLEHADLTDKEFRTVVAVTLAADREGEFSVSAKDLAGMVKTDQRYAFRLLGALKQKGYIEEVTPGSGRRPSKRRLTEKALT